MSRCGCGNLTKNGQEFCLRCSMDMKGVFMLGVTFATRPRVLKQLDRLAGEDGLTRREALQKMMDEYLDAAESQWKTEDAGEQGAAA